MLPPLCSRCGGSALLPPALSVWWVHAAPSAALSVWWICTAPGTVLSVQWIRAVQCCALGVVDPHCPQCCALGAVDPRCTETVKQLVLQAGLSPLAPLGAFCCLMEEHCPAARTEYTNTGLCQMPSSSFPNKKGRSTTQRIHTLHLLFGTKNKHFMFITICVDITSKIHLTPHWSHCRNLLKLTTILRFTCLGKAGKTCAAD